VKGQGKLSEVTPSVQQFHIPESVLEWLSRGRNRDDNVWSVFERRRSRELFEVGFNHFFRACYDDQPGDFVYLQGHAAPGVYARAFLEGRFTEEHLRNFRHELRGTPGLSSYPHPWLMPEFWQFPSVSMGLVACSCDRAPNYAPGRCLTAVRCSD